MTERNPSPQIRDVMLAEVVGVATGPQAPDRIAAAALRTDDGTIYTLPPPARHHTIMQHFKFCATPDQQGFITDSGMWVGRKPALRIADEAGQIILGPTAPAHGLFSEDVW